MKTAGDVTTVDSGNIAAALLAPIEAVTLGFTPVGHFRNIRCVDITVGRRHRGYLVSDFTVLVWACT